MSWAEEQDWFGLEDLAFEAEAHQSTIEELVRQGTWTTKDGTEIPIPNMTDRHLYNAIKMIREGRLKREYALPILLNEQKRRNGSNKQK